LVTGNNYSSAGRSLLAHPGHLIWGNSQQQQLINAMHDSIQQASEMQAASKSIRPSITHSIK
jgi:hypothetical protein